MSTLNVNNINEAGGVDAVITAGVLDSGSLPAGSILQVVNANSGTTFSTTSSSYVDVTGLSVNVTPKSTSSQILVMLNLRFGGTASQTNELRVDRSGTAIDFGDNYLGNVYSAHNNAAQGFADYSIMYLDSPASTSSLTYSVQVRTNTGTLYINNRNDGNGATELSSSITVMEVAG